MKTDTLRRAGMWGVIAVGFLQMAGWGLKSETLLGLGFITNAAPLPLVFSMFRGIEPFSSKFSLTVVSRGGEEREFPVTPDSYARLEGPYNLRNVYGAVFAGGPRLESPKEKAMWEAIVRFGFCQPGTVAQQFGLGTDIREIRVAQLSRARGIAGHWVQSVRCEP